MSDIPHHFDSSDSNVNQCRESVDIPLYSMLFFRGDMPHAGAGYSKTNHRLFLSVSLDKFPVTENVFIVN